MMDLNVMSSRPAHRDNSPVCPALNLWNFNTMHNGLEILSGADLARVEPWVRPVDARVAALEQTLIDVRRHLHAHPEPSCGERETSRYLAEQLKGAGIECRVCRDGLGVMADIELGEIVETTPRIALRADIDALKLEDTKTTPYRSQNPGLCHACGHDAHSTMVLGAALCCAELQRNGSIPGASGLRMRFIFQPAEEESVGAQWMVEQGAVDDVDAILGLHVDPERTLGVVGIRYGTLTAACDDVEIIVEGKGGHSARPHHTRDPISAAAHLVSALYQFLPRSVDCRNAAVFSVGKIQGGALPNVIPDRVEILGSLRTLDQQTRVRLKNRIEEIVHGAKEASGAGMHLRIHMSIDPVHNDPRCTAALEAASRDVLGDDGVQLILQPSMGGEDFSAYLTRVPGAMLRLGCAPPGFSAPFLHAPDFDVDERILTLGTRILLRAAVYLAAERQPPHAGENI